MVGSGAVRRYRADGTRLADRFQRRGEPVAAGEARVADALVLREQAFVAEHRVGHRARTGERRQHAVPENPCSQKRCPWRPMSGARRMLMSIWPPHA